jgi:hypothetical protein
MMNSGEKMTSWEESYDNTVQALGDALAMKGAESEGHSKRVTAFSIAIARRMDMSPDRNACGGNGNLAGKGKERMRGKQLETIPTGVTSC